VRHRHSQGAPNPLPTSARVRVATRLGHPANAGATLMQSLNQTAEAGHPVYDPFDYAVQEDPYPVFAWMREHAPLYRNEKRDFWALSRYADVSAALRDPARYSSRNGI